MKPKAVTTQMKAPDQYLLMVLFVLLLKRVHFLVMKPKGVTTQMKALDECIQMVLFMLLLKTVHFPALKNKQTNIYLDRKTWR